MLTNGGKITILDEYDCEVMRDRIRIAIVNPRDPSITDIMSEIHYSEGSIYFDDKYYEYDNGYDIFPIGQSWYLDLLVRI